MLRKKLYSHRVTGKAGQYQAPSKSYSRKRCVLTMLGLDPDLKVIFVKKGPVTFEKAILSRKRLAMGRTVWHFYATHKVDDVELAGTELSSC
jgi:hypothetical protein